MTARQVTAAACVACAAFVAGCGPDEATLPPSNAQAAASGAPSASGDGASVAIRPGRAAAEPATAATVETGDTRGGAGQRVAVQSLDGTFRPGRITVTTGTEVEWTNVGHQTHDILPVEGSGWGVAEADFGPGATYAHTFDEPGTYDYYCTLHGTAHAGMIGTIIVTG